MYLDRPAFIVFLALALVAFYLTPVSRRWIALLGVSLLFYATFLVPGLLAVFFVGSWIAWYTGRAVDRAEDNQARWRWLVLGTGGLGAVLVWVRLVSAPALLPTWYPVEARLGLTIGVSYYSLQAMSYVADIYLGRIRSEPNIAKVATYLVFFPKLIQGPIERAGSIMPQLKAPGIPDYGGLRSAAVLFGAGLFKKVVLGDRLAQVADPLFADPSQFGGMATVVATYAYAFQLYFDFSGYTDMARASARVLGIELSENFRTPYLASSLSDFWRRWHITFSRWLLEYVFSPLQAMWRRAPVTGTAAALLVTFVLSGAWHGFTGPFMVWGLLHGTYLAVESISRKIRGRRPPTYPLWQEVWGTVLTFNLVVVAWVFFRAPSLEVAWAVIRSVIEPTPRIGPLAQACGGLYALGITLAACSAYAFLVAVRSRTIYRNLMQHTVVRWALYFSLVTAVTFLRQGGAGFLYAQF